MIEMSAFRRLNAASGPLTGPAPPVAPLVMIVFASSYGCPAGHLGSVAGVVILAGGVLGWCHCFQMLGAVQRRFPHRWSTWKPSGIGPL